MKLKEISEKINKLNIYQKRYLADDYCEVVFLAKDFVSWENLLHETLGEPVKPSEKPPTKEDSAITKNYGGIYKGQTLYKKEFDDYIVIAMFWPWQDGLYITLKVASLKK